MAPPVRSREPVTRDRIVAAAERLVDAHGLDGLSMRRLGAELGVEAMSLYGHVAGKDAILDLLVERLVTRVLLPAQDIPWDAALADMARGFREAARAHPNVFLLLASRPAPTPTLLVYLDHVLGILERAGFSPHDTVFVYRAAYSYVIGHLLGELVGGLGANADEREALARSLADVDPRSLPRVLRHASAIVEGDVEAQFEFGLEVVLSGLRGKLADESGG